MKTKLKITVSTIVWTMLLLAAYAVTTRAQSSTTNQSLTKKESSAQAAGTAVTGSGTAGRLSKWAGVSGTSYILGDSYIFEDKFGKVGIGTLTPTSPLTVQGMIETTLGGYKFPDGTVQTTA